MIRSLCHAALALVAAGLTGGGGTLAAQDETEESSVSRTEAIQINIPDSDATARAGRAYLDSNASSAPPRDGVVQTSNSQISRGNRNTPASQISARRQSGLGMTQLSKADLEATLAQLTAAERRVLLQAIDGTDICDNPPDVAAIVTLCQTRLETRASEFAARSERSLSAEDQLLRGDLESSVLPSVDQVIDRLARGGASSGDFSNQAIASIALGSSVSTPARPGEEERTDTSSLGEETQALINALINQLGGRAP